MQADIAFQPQTENGYMKMAESISMQRNTGIDNRDSFAQQMHSVALVAKELINQVKFIC